MYISHFWYTTWGLVAIRTHIHNEHSSSEVTSRSLHVQSAQTKRLLSLLKVKYISNNQIVKYGWIFQGFGVFFPFSPPSLHWLGMKSNQIRSRNKEGG